MRIKILAFSLMLAVLASGNAGVVLAKQSRVIQLVAKDGAKIATIHVNDQSLRFESNNNAGSFFFDDQAVVTMNHTDRTYRVQSYADIEASLSRKAAEISQSHESPGAPKGVELKLTEETDTISGLKARKLIKTNKGETEVEFWISSELLPPRVRALGERLRSILPTDYWSRVHGNPGMVEIVILFGVPLRMTYGHESYQARGVNSSSSDSSFQVPAGYRKLDN